MILYEAAVYAVIIIASFTLAPLLFYGWFKSYSVIQGNHLINFRFFRKISKKILINDIKRLSVYNYDNRGFSLVVRATLKDNSYLDLFSIDHLSSKQGAAKYFFNTLYLVQDLKSKNSKIIITKGLQSHLKRYEKLHRKTQ